MRRTTTTDLWSCFVVLLVWVGVPTLAFLTTTSPPPAKALSVSQLSANHRHLFEDHNDNNNNDNNNNNHGLLSPEASLLSRREAIAAAAMTTTASGLLLPRSAFANDDTTTSTTTTTTTVVPKVGLGTSSLQVSRTIQGHWQLAGGHGKIREADALANMEAHYKAGITTLDTADIYGPSEIIVGKFMARHPDAIPCTKFCCFRFLDEINRDEVRQRIKMVRTRVIRKMTGE
jgi:Aldo/keto reductase family